MNHKDDLIRFIKNTRIVRNAIDISAKELAKQANLKRVKAIEDWETGRSIPTLDDIVAICKVFDLKMDDMLFQNVNVKLTFTKEEFENPTNLKTNNNAIKQISQS